MNQQTTNNDKSKLKIHENHFFLICDQKLLSNKKKCIL